MSIALAEDDNIKYCQSCIQRGFSPPQVATREWQTGMFYCEECFDALLNNLTNIAPAEASDIVKNIPPSAKGPVLDYLYQAYGVPKELQFDKVDTVCRNHDKIFNFHAPAVINRTLEELASEVEQLQMSLFHIKYRIEPLEMHIRKLKEDARKEANLKSYDDAKETYSKKPRKVASGTLDVTKEEKEAKKLNMTLTEYRQFKEIMAAKAKKNNERKFNLIVGNCGECGGPMPCSKHPIN